MKARLAILLAALAAVLPILVGRAAVPPHRPAPDPAGNARFASFREVTRLTATPDGSVWAATTGGLLERAPGGGGEWQEVPATAAIPACPIPLWHGKPVALAPDGTPHLGRTALPFPPGSPGTHFSAAAVGSSGELLAVLWGDAALYHCRAPGATWTREAITLPGGGKAGSQITALAAGADGGALFLGTRRAGIWERGAAASGAAWRPVPLTQTGPFAHDAEAMARFHGDLYVSTLEDGLAVWTADGWQHIDRGDLSGSAPRQMVVFQDALYIRQGDGKVDRFDGSAWTPNVWAGQLPRKQVSALATDGRLLYAAEWGGWSVWDGATWRHHLQTPELQGLPITTLLPNGNTLWLGTQGHGLAEADAATGAIRAWHDERRGMPDDWITALARCVSDGRIYAGTFVGGLACLSPGAARWTTVTGTEGENITDLLVVPAKNGENDSAAIYAATRHGVRRFMDTAAAAGPIRASDDAAPPSVIGGKEIEAQALCAGVSGGGLWVGTRTGLYFARP